jgi:amino acid adenylation domain-containing protein
MTAPATLVDLFAYTAHDHPGLVAVLDDDTTLTYAELAHRSTSCAHLLRQHGIRPGDRVVVYLDRGVDVFVAILGILEAGAAYVAVDTRYPDARRDLMIRHSDARLVVTDATLRTHLSDVDTLVLAEPTGPTGPLPAPHPRDEACVLFTSGSSGTPKAVVLEHHNLVGLAVNAGLPALLPEDRVGQVSSLSFDAFHVETWCAFAHGARVVVLPTMPELVARDLSRELRRRRITAMLAPTMAVNHVVHEDREAFSALRILYTGGDVLQPAASRAITSGGFAGEFHNLYGPTEGTTACTAHRITPEDGAEGSVPIGRPLAGATVLVLDEKLREVPSGTAGQLYLGGSGVARGYHARPDLTATRFVAAPFGPPGARMYATGDLARRDEAGTLEFLGRVDDQVKIRGYRVEPREAERAVLRHPAVRDAAVVVVGDDHDRRLAALVVLHDRVPPRQLREFAAAMLPDYLVPSVFVPVPEIPGNDHGKRDLAKLYDTAVADLRRAGSRVEPCDDIERYLVELWEELLAVDWIGTADDFFALGGNSLLGFRVQRRIRRDLGVEIDVQDVLETSELSGLAELVRTRRTATVGAP